MQGKALPMLLTAAFLLGAAAFLAPSTVAQAGVGTSSLSGLVCSAENVYYIRAPDGGQACDGGRGIPGATVRLTRSGTVGPVGAVDKTATTDDNGSYSFTQLSDGEHTLAVSRAGFAGVTTTADVQGDTRLDVPLTGQDVTVGGKVLSAKDGKAIPGAIVSVCCSPTAGSTQAETAADGSFSVKTTAGWRSFYASQARGHQESGQDLFVDGQKAVELRLEPVPPQDASVSGRVTDQSGRAVAGVRLDLSSYPNYDEPQPACPPGAVCDVPAYQPYRGGSNYTVSGADGRYTMRAYGGSQAHLSVQHPGYAPFSSSFAIARGEAKAVDVQLQKYPEKTAHLTGRVTDAATGNALANAYLNLRSPQVGLSECSQPASAGGSSSGTAGSTSPPVKASYSPGAYPDRPGCAITMQPDGTFSGLVTPGYTVVDVYRGPDCHETGDADGSMRRDCGPEYLGWMQTLTLPANATTELAVRLVSRPAPDAVVSGYLVDAQTGKAIPNAHVSFSNSESYGYGYATTDADGSYAIRLRSGYHAVHASAEGHFSWQGNLQVAAGENPFDVTLTPGQEAYGGYGGCGYGAPCMAYAEDTAAHARGGSAPMTSSGTQPPSPGLADGSLDSGAGAGDSQTGSTVYEDLHGGLGPYDAAARSKTLQDASKGSPGLQVLLVLGVLAVGAALLKKRAAR